jgi:hypothetical protein
MLVLCRCCVIVEMGALVNCFESTLATAQLILDVLYDWPKVRTHFLRLRRCFIDNHATAEWALYRYIDSLHYLTVNFEVNLMYTLRHA